MLILSLHFRLSKDTFLRLYVHPSAIRKHIVGYTNPRGDGNCGYRSVAVALGKSQEDWREIKKDMIHELDKNREVYTKKNYSSSIFYNHSFEKFRRLLRNTDSPVEKDYWLSFPAHAYILANAYKRPIMLFSALQPLTFFPTLHPPNDNPPIFICLLCALHHFISVNLSSNFPAPPLYAPWKENRIPEADKWEDKYRMNLDLGKKVFNTQGKVRSSRGPVILDDSD
ncbi:hypothetical protein DFH28DRAFT_890756 [Melampsora americana]|nr:hypothetical protein DFH28DRAFT_890756 [Melampsora americana]